MKTRFDEKYRRIWECLSTDMLGNSQPTGGVFSGDNFARGDMRVPMVLGWGVPPRRRKERRRRRKGSDER
jgi:hypothetical protein